MCNCGCQCKGKHEKCCKRLKHIKRCPTETKSFYGCDPYLTVTVHKTARKVRVHRDECENDGGRCGNNRYLNNWTAYPKCTRYGCSYNFGLDYVNDW